ncbi:MAG: ParB/RepB/Spo0J family partition protein [Gammaproteobacteria bacterium]|nr:ParB/RepB/Spo0J family partition protein [Gammaproteobacteria bacterium]
MTARKRGLGRGLDALLGSAARQEKPAPELKAVSVPDVAVPPADGALCALPVDVIERGEYQPRVDMHQESLQDLADSISVQGVVQPIVVRSTGENRFEIIAGERRWRAAQMAGLHEIPAVVREVDDRSAIAIALIENIQRENLNPLEEARALERLIKEFELTHEQAAEAVGRSRAAVSNILRLLDLNDSVKGMLECGDIEMGHARALLALGGAKQIEAARQVIARGLSVRATEGLIRQLLQKRTTKPPAKPKDPDIQKLESRLSDKLGASVLLRQGKGGKGKLEISYNSLDELDGILEHIH